MGGGVRHQNVGVTTIQAHIFAKQRRLYVWGTARTCGLFFSMNGYNNLSDCVGNHKPQNCSRQRGADSYQTPIPHQSFAHFLFREALRECM